LYVHTFRTLIVLAVCVAVSACAREIKVTPEIGLSAAFLQAEGASRAGRLADALGWYEKILSTPALPEDARRRAERGVAFLRLADNAELRDVKRARELLSALAEPRVDGSSDSDARVVINLLDEIDAANAATEKVRAELAASRATNEATKQSFEEMRKKAEAAGSSSASSRKEIEALRAQMDAARIRQETTIAHLNAELANLRSELEKKDAALKRIAARLAGRGQD
jgi:hypothetical protein